MEGVESRVTSLRVEGRFAEAAEMVAEGLLLPLVRERGGDDMSKYTELLLTLEREERASMVNRISKLEGAMESLRRDLDARLTGLSKEFRRRVKILESDIIGQDDEII